MSDEHPRHWLGEAGGRSHGAEGLLRGKPLAQLAQPARRARRPWQPTGARRNGTVPRVAYEELRVFVTPVAEFRIAEANAFGQEER
jgi:hypothetical protein